MEYMKTEKEICDQYNKIFELWHKDAEEINSPAPQITLYGFQHNSGWHGIIEGLCKTLDQLNVSVTVVQSKEKFGGLRFYHNGIRHDDENKVQQALGAIRATENQSFHVCEECGAPGELRRNGWMRTRCDDCYDEPDRRLP